MRAKGKGDVGEQEEEAKGRIAEEFDVTVILR